MTSQVIPIGEIGPSGLNPPGRLDPQCPDLQSLLASVREYGVREPPTVYRDPKAGRYVLLSGHRRWFCARAAGHVELACLVADPPAGPGEERLAQAVVNIHRRAYTPVELARLVRDLMADFGLTGREAADKLHVSPALVSTHLALLRLGDAHQGLIDRGRLSLSVGALMSQTDHEGLRARMADMALGGATRAEVAAALRGSRPTPRRLTLRAGRLGVSAAADLPVADLVRGLEGLLRQARRAAADGRGLDALTDQPPAPKPG